MARPPAPFSRMPYLQLSIPVTQPLQPRVERALEDVGALAITLQDAHLDELMTRVQQTGAELKGFAPLLVDFPADLDGVPVLLCWTEGEAELGWYHRVELGYAGRRPLPLASV